MLDVSPPGNADLTQDHENNQSNRNANGKRNEIVRGPLARQDSGTAHFQHQSEYVYTEDCSECFKPIGKGQAVLLTCGCCVIHNQCRKAHNAGGSVCACGTQSHSVDSAHLDGCLVGRCDRDANGKGICPLCLAEWAKKAVDWVQAAVRLNIQDLLKKIEFSLPVKHNISGPILKKIGNKIISRARETPVISTEESTLVYFTALLAATVTETPVKISDVWHEHGRLYGSRYMSDWLNYAARCPDLQVVQQVYVRKKSPLGIFDAKSMETCLKHRGILCTNTDKIVVEYPDAAKDLAKLHTKHRILYLSTNRVVHSGVIGKNSHVKGARKRWTAYRKGKRKNTH